VSKGDTVTAQTSTRPTIETGTWALDKSHAKIGFTAKHLMVSKVRGHFENFDAKVEIARDLSESKIEVELEAASITTGAADRDGHLLSGDFLDVENHPKLRFVSTDIAGDGEAWKVTGDLTIRDVTRPITLDVVYEGSVIDPWGNEKIGFSASAKMNREDWGLTWNAALEGGGWLVSKDVTLEIEGELGRA
jgi:polyisoprenoid-binding protein YceI